MTAMSGGPLVAGGDAAVVLARRPACLEAPCPPPAVGACTE
jgi:hypothetical protein